jgi:hypothetical protein
MTTARKERSTRKTAMPAAIQLAIRITCFQLVCGFALAIHWEPSQRHLPSAEMAGCH